MIAGKSLTDNFISCILHVYHKYIPCKLARKRNDLPYITQEVEQLMTKRDRLHAKKDPRYKEHVIQRKLRAAYWKYLEDIITPTDSAGAPAVNKRFWSFTKHSKSDTTGVPPLKKQGLTVTSAVEKAEVLNYTFHSVFTPVPPDSHLPRDTCSPYPRCQISPSTLRVLENSLIRSSQTRQLDQTLLDPDC